MALSEGQMSRLRMLVAEPDESTFSDNSLSAIFEANSSDMAATAAEIWDIKAAQAALLVDTSEGQSSRKNSQVASQALALAAQYRAQVTTATEATSTRATTVRSIERI